MVQLLPHPTHRTPATGVGNTVLYISADTRFAAAVQGSLRVLFEEWNITFATSAQQARRLLAHTAFAVVVCDAHLPDGDGLELLTQVARRWPHAARIVQCDASDTQSAVRAIHVAHKLLHTPCPEEMIRATLHRAVAIRTLLNGDEMRAVVAHITHLPTIPSLYMRVMEETGKPNGSMARIGDLIAGDVGMTTHVLKLVNSAFFGMPQRVSSPAQAVTLLGLDTIKSLILIVDVFQQYDTIRALAPGFSLEALQQHALVTAGFARAIARYQRCSSSFLDDVYLAGLFHDVGKLVLMANLPQQYHRALAGAKAQGIALEAAERQVFGVSHAEVGAYLLGLWGFPDHIVSACAYHHQPARADDLRGFNEVMAIHVASVLAHQLRPLPAIATGSKLNLAYLKQNEMFMPLLDWQQVCEQLGYDG